METIIFALLVGSVTIATGQTPVHHRDSQSAKAIINPSISNEDTVALLKKHDRNQNGKIDIGERKEFVRERALLSKARFQAEIAAHGNNATNTADGSKLMRTNRVSVLPIRNDALQRFVQNGRTVTPEFDPENPKAQTEH